MKMILITKAILSVVNFFLVTAQPLENMNMAPKNKK